MKTRPWCSLSQPGLMRSTLIDKIPITLFALPEYLLLDVYSEWLCMEDICALDSALCNTSLRKAYLRMISADILACSGEKKFASKLDYFKWITERRITIKELNMIMKDGNEVDQALYYITNDKKSFSMLTRLNIANNHAITDAHIQTIVEQCSFLSYLDLTLCSSITDTSLYSIAQHCPALTHLDLHDCNGVSDDGLIRIARSCSLLTYLDIDDNGNFTTRAISVVAHGCRALTHINLSWCNLAVDDNALRSIGQFLPCLTHLDLTDCNQITDDALFALAYGCPLLSYLSIAWCENASCLGLNLLLHRCHLIRVLDLEGFNVVGMRIANRCLSSMDELNLSNIEDLTADILSSIALNCLHLKKLSLRAVHYVSLSVLLSASPLPLQLETIDFADCTQISSSFVGELAAKCPHLKDVNLTKCALVSIAAIRKLLRLCSHMVKLTVYERRAEVKRKLALAYPMVEIK